MKIFKHEAHTVRAASTTVRDGKGHEVFTFESFVSFVFNCFVANS